MVLNFTDLKKSLLTVLDSLVLKSSFHIQFNLPETDLATLSNLKTQENLTTRL